MNPEDLIHQIYGKRNQDCHKYDFGHLLVVGGSKLYSGSPAFNSLAAYRAGADLVTTASPRRAADIVATFSPSLITYPLEGDILKDAHIKELNGLKEKATAVAIGGGLGRDKETLKATVEFLGKLDLPVVIDADAIHAVADSEDVLGEGCVVTPHRKEFEVLTGRKASDGISERKEQAKSSAQELGCVVLLKGNVDIISDGDSVVENETGTPYMTVGGTGDTLVGIAGALLARGLDPLKAAHVSAFINGRAGEESGKEEGMMPEDILEEISGVIENLG